MSERNAEVEHYRNEKHEGNIRYKDSIHRKTDSNFEVGFHCNKSAYYENNIRNKHIAYNGENTYNVGIYCRLSKDDSNSSSSDESTSIIHQKDMLIRYTQKEGWNLVRIYSDDGYSGTNFQRPDFMSMIQDIKNGVINLVLTKDVSRSGRNYAETGYYTDTFFPDNNIRFVAVNDGIDSIAENDITPFKHVLNEMYAKDISRKTRSAKRTLAENGKFANSRAPYGYVKSPLDKHLLVVDEISADNVKRIYTMFLSGKSGRLITDIFNQEGILAPNAHYYASIKKATPKNQSVKWGSGTILNIIRNPVYKGVMVNGKRKVMSFKNKSVIANPSDTWIVVENTHEPIVNKSIWDEAQKIVSRNKKGIRRSSNGEVSLFSGIAKCGTCGTKMTFNRKIYQSYTKEYYRCGKYTNKGTNACKPHTILQDTLYNTVIADIRQYAKLAFNDEQQLIDRLTKDNANHNAQASQRHKRLMKEKEYRLAEIGNLIQSLFEDKVSGVVPENIFKRMAKKYDDEQLAITHELKQLHAELADLKKNESDIASWVTKIRQCLSIETSTREIIVELIDSISVSEVYEIDGEQRQDLNIVYRFESLVENLDSINNITQAS